MLQCAGALHPSWLWQQRMHNPPRPQCKFVKTLLQQKSPRAVFPNFIELVLQASLVVAVLVLLYCLYVVQDWLDMLTHDQVNIIQNLEPNIFSPHPLHQSSHRVWRRSWQQWAGQEQEAGKEEESLLLLLLPSPHLHLSQPQQHLRLPRHLLRQRLLPPLRLFSMPLYLSPLPHLLRPAARSTPLRDRGRCPRQWSPGSL